MDWATLVPVLVGGVIALGGSLLGSWVSDQRATERERRAWDREDRLRTFDQRRDAYARFVSVSGSAMSVVSPYRPESKDSTMVHEQTLRFLFDMNEAWTEVEIYATPKVTAAAFDTYRKTTDWALVTDVYSRGVGKHKDDYEPIAEMEEAMQDSHAGLLRAVRADLGIPFDA